MKKPRLRVRTVLFVAGVAGICLVARFGFAGHGTAVPSYTGCLNLSSGTFTSVAPGNAPLSSCGASQIQIHLSGGDITRVVAGSGLTGGATEGVATLQVDEATIPTGITAGFGLVGGGTGGDITLAVDPATVQKRIVNTCHLGLGGRAIVTVDESGIVECSNGPLVFHGQKGGLEDLTEDFSPIGSLFLTRASYLVIAKLSVYATGPLLPGNDFMDVDCRLTAGGELDNAILAGDVDVEAGGTMTMMVAADLPTDAFATVECKDGANSTNLRAQMAWKHLKISAIRLDNVFNFPI